MARRDLVDKRVKEAQKKVPNQHDANLDTHGITLSNPSRTSAPSIASTHVDRHLRTRVPCGSPRTAASGRSARAFQTCCHQHRQSRMSFLNRELLRTTTTVGCLHESVSDLPRRQNPVPCHWSSPQLRMKTTQLLRRIGPRPRPSSYADSGCDGCGGNMNGCGPPAELGCGGRSG